MPRRKNRKPRRRRNNKKSTVPKALSLGPYMPQSIIAKHKYTTTFALSQDYTSATIQSNGNNIHSFKLNCLSDPDSAGTGVPRFFDEMHTFYNTYRVIGAKARVKFINLSKEPAYIFAYKGAQQFSASSAMLPRQLNELKGIRKQILHSLDSGPNSVRTITIGYSPEKQEGKSRAVIRGDPSFEALATGEPVEKHYLSLAALQVSSALGGQENLNVQVEVAIDFTAIWNDRKIQAEST